MLFRLRDTAGRTVFNAAARAVLDTPPIRIVDGGAARIAIVSQLQSKDVLPWLVAAKSFYARLGRGRMVLVDDGSLTNHERSLIAAHVIGVEIWPLASGRVAGLPEGGTWERLCVIAGLARDAYVMQLDSDTVTLGPLDAVEELIAANRPFAIADADAPTRSRPETFAAYHAARGVPHSRHMQIAAEIAFKDAGLPADRMYVRGSSAFAGFPAGADAAPLLHEIHAAMTNAIGERWREWGSEQVASNYAVANLGDAALLKPPMFANHEPQTDISAASLVHFYGTHRHYLGRYPAAARRAISMMKSAA